MEFSDAARRAAWGLGQIVARSVLQGGRPIRIAAAVALVLSLAACASLPGDPVERAAFERTNDPAEPTNRTILDVNMFIDKWAIEPIAEVYRDGVPEPLRTALHNLLQWAREPTVLANNLMQGDLPTAGRTTARFMINTLLGPVGLRDMAAQQGYGRQVGDFGQTLYVYGFPEGPYLMLPLLGPSNVRDALGKAADTFIDPFRYFSEINESTLASWGRFGAEGVDERSRNIDSLDALKRNAVDFYAELRSVVRQRRAAQLHKSRPDTAPQSDDLYSDPALIGQPAK
jgi:phospholipid-binding lipoprotein MlaA